MKKRFVTIVPHIENLGLRKDTGQIPYQSYKILNCDATLVSYFYTLTGGRTTGPIQNPSLDKNYIYINYPYLETEVPGLKMHFLQNKGRGKFYEKAILDYLKLNSKNIDILNLFHFSSENIFYTFYYKWKNPSGKVYLKLDIDIHFYETKKRFINIGNKIPFIGKVFEHTIIKLFFNQVTLISAESNNGLNYFKKRFNPPAQKLLLLQNGVDSERILDLIGKVKSFSEKENIILTVGRIGNIQKNTLFLLDTITKIKLKDWKLYLVGPIESGFEIQIEKFFTTYPEYKDKVIFTGATANPKELYQYYNRAKVFCLPSLYEGFPLAACEAIFFGCYPILSNRIYGALDLTNGRSDQLFNIDNRTELSNILSSIIDGKKKIRNSYLDTIKLSNANFIWRNSIRKLSGLITDV